MSREDDIINDIEKNLKNQYKSEYMDALIEFGDKGRIPKENKNPKGPDVIDTSRKPSPSQRSEKKELKSEYATPFSADNRQPVTYQQTANSRKSTPAYDDDDEVMYGDYEKKSKGKKKKRQMESESKVNSPQEPSVPVQSSVPTEPPKRKKKHRLLKAFIIIVALLALLIFGTHAALTAFVSKTDYKPYKTEYVRGSDVKSSPMVTNILIIGSDARNPDADSRSDAMIIASINRSKHKIVLTSILRDSYVNIPGHGGDKINAAFQFGGADLLIQTIETNFKVGIDYYVNIDFFSFVKIIDDLGGVTIDVDSDELPYVNSYLNEINALLNKPAGDSYLTTPGKLLLNGRQALSYSRIRYIGMDFERTSRQREVINAVIGKFKKQNPVKMLGTMQQILPELTTNIPDSKMAWYIMESPWFLTFKNSEFRIPADNTWKFENIDGKDAIRVDLEANTRLWQEAVYK